MSINVQYNGTTYSLPQTNDTGYGDQVTSWMVDVSQSSVTANAPLTLTQKTLTAPIINGGTLNSVTLNNASLTGALSVPSLTVSGNTILSTLTIGGAATAITQPSTDNSTNIATTAYVKSIASLPPIGVVPDYMYQAIGII